MKIYQVFLDTYHLDGDWDEWWRRRYEAYFTDKQTAIEHMQKIAQDKKLNTKLRERHFGYADEQSIASRRIEIYEKERYAESFQLPNVIALTATYYCNKCGVREIDLQRMEDQNMKVYELKVDWAFDDNGKDVTTGIYETEEKARKAMNAEIVQAMQDYGVFDEETGELTDSNYVVENGESYWRLYRKSWWENCHCLITVTEKEVI